MNKIANIIEMRMAEAASQTAQQVENQALAELHHLAVDMAKIADSVEDRLGEMEKQVRIIATPPPRQKPAPKPIYEQPIFLLQVAVGLLMFLIFVTIYTVLRNQQMVCQPTKNPGVTLCKKI
jgi:hypothetical protein